ncbi:MAG: glycosyltransferase family 4 protein [Chloroflexi bacterium]|nr:MAG: glycosyltransferase family 4 protein [Chloroflexota bacterium]
MRRLRVALIAPPWYPLPPHGYGGTELVVHLLGRELRALGHDVRIFGAEGSGPGVDQVAPAAWAGDLGGPNARMREAAYLRRVFKRIQSEHFDVIHDHSGPVGTLLALESHRSNVVVHTIHSALEEPELDFYRELGEKVVLVAISQAQAAAASSLPINAVIHNAVDVSALDFRSRKEGYLVELARVCPAKGQHLAIALARRLNRKLIIAGKVEPGAEGQRYFENYIEPQLGSQVEYWCNVAGREKAELLARAAAGVFPLQWPEPFGLALVETMASGTPVLAIGNGAAHELVEPGVTGFVGKTIEDLVEDFQRLGEIDPVRCASVARRRFSPRRMAEGYVGAYGGIAAADRVQASHASGQIPAVPAS